MADNKQNPKTPAVSSSKAQDYLRSLLLFWGFLLAVALVGFFACGGVMDGVFQGVLEFIFVILGGGFTLVTVLHYLYEEYTQPQGMEKK